MRKLFRGGASISTCTGYNGVGCHVALEAQYAQLFDLPPINSTTLDP
ncbi:hypothetical protein ACFV29_43440 [Streptomyces sp. NPDC059690]